MLGPGRCLGGRDMGFRGFLLCERTRRHDSYNGRERPDNVPFHDIPLFRDARCAIVFRLSQSCDVSEEAAVRN
jgi:hypothetical protein